ncbi:MAG TPA: glycosyl hydrolase [Terriglobia bacterium]|nr:glycosyl hydrolase [Terriglobia bacterium]
MLPINRRTFLGITATGLGGLWLGGPNKAQAGGPNSSAAMLSLYKAFRDPDRKYSIRPFWFWNGKLTGEELARQIRQMVDQGVFGAYAHNRDGLETPYLSEEWWQVLGSALKTSREVGFSLCMVDEFEWPSGEARDFWLPGINKSRVVAANPEYRMRQLHPVEKRFRGPERVEVDLPAQTKLVVAGKFLGAHRIEGSSLREVPFDSGAKTVSWNVPAGDWFVTAYVLEPAFGLDGGTVDLMNPDAVREFIKVYYEEFYRRYGEYFGNAMPATFADHEGTYGGQLAWTPRLFDTFRRVKGYDLETRLPMLTYDAGAQTEKLRCDYQDVISQLYADSFFKQVDDWCREHKIEYSGHVWEESLFFGPAYQGDFYRILRAMSNPGSDSLVEWGHQSVWLKEVASVADFEGRRLVCENQGVQGGDSYLSPERMRRVSNCLGAWNVGEFIPHAFDYDLKRINFAPDWFESQPFRAHFHFYADQMRRISFMNCDSRLVADILLYYPQVSIWGQSAPVYLFQWVPGGVQASSVWSEDANRTNSDYAELKRRLSEERLDYQVTDDSYLAESKLEGKELVISTARFRTLVLPPMSTIRRSSAERVEQFYRAGGTVVAQACLPFTSVEEGREDARLKALWDSMFDTTSTLQPFTLRTNADGGRAYFVPGLVEDVVTLLRRIVDHDADIVSGPADHLYVLHKQKGGIDFYWVVNDTSEPRTNLLRLRAKGRPERWDAVTGKYEPVYYQTAESHTLVRVSLHPWDATYIVFDPEGPAQDVQLNSMNLDEVIIESASPAEITVRGRKLAGEKAAFVELKQGEKTYRGNYQPGSIAPLEISGEWTVTVDSPTITLPYADVKDDPEDRGLRERWFEKESPIMAWDRLWLSPMNCSIRKWNLIGPFPNPEDRGLEQSFPPEKEINFEAAYEGDSSRQVRWLEVDSNEPRVAPEYSTDWNWAMVPTTGGRYAKESHVVDYGRVLKLGRRPGGTVFAQTYVFAPEAADAVVILATACPSTVWCRGEKVYSRWVRPFYHELNDGFAYRIPVRLAAGWNSLLIKLLHNPLRTTRPAFTCRVERPEGGHIQGVITATRQASANRMTPPTGYRWLRFRVPRVARAMRVPRFDGTVRVFVDGLAEDLRSEIPLPAGTRAVVFRVSAGEVLDRPFEFVTAATPWTLGTWSVPGLEHFSGSMTYEKTVEVPGALLKERVLLDCGEVGVTAEAWVNDTHVGARVWQPYVFDVTEQLRPGKNQIKVRVANTEANARAVGDSVDILKNIDLNGWLGPVRLLPFIDRTIRCAAV